MCLSLESIEHLFKRPSPAPFTVAQPSLLDQYDYVTYGKCFKIEAVASGGGGGSREPKVAVMISFGGLLMKLAGDQRCVFQFSSCIYRCER